MDECGNRVTDRIREEEAIQPEDWVGYTEGIPSVCQTSYYYYHNAKFFEESIKKGFFRGGLLGVPLMIHYLSSDDWYTQVPDHIRAKHRGLTTHRVPN